MRRLLPTAIFFTATLAGSAAAQPAPPGDRVALSDTQRSRLEATLIARPEVRAAVRGTPRVRYSAPEYDKAEVEAYVTGQTAVAPTPHVEVLILGAQGSGARATVALSDQRVLSVTPIAPGDAPFVDEDIAEALGLAREAASARAALGRSLDGFVPAQARRVYPRETLLAEALPLRSSDPKDPCSRDRCLELIFRTPEGYLPVRVQVNLTRRTSTPIRPTEGHHP